MPLPADNGVRLVGGRTTRLARGALRMKPPRGFEGRVRVTPVETGRRHISGVDADTPPGLVGAGELFQPLELPDTDGLPEPVAIELDALAGSSRQITPATPLTIDLDIPGERGLIEVAQGLLAVAFDGDAYYPVGRSTTLDHIDIEWLPELAETASAAGLGGLGGRARLLIYQVIGWPEPMLGLYRAQVVRSDLKAKPLAAGEHSQPHADGETRYRAVTAGELQPGQRVALVVHGFGLSTGRMVAELDTLFEQHGIQYDHTLTFDYATLRAGVRAAGSQLAAALRELGFDSQDGLTLDVFGHGLGALVVRYMIEIAGGRRYVDRAFLAGPPNHGTQLASLKGGVTWLVTLGLNLTGSSLPGMIAGWALNIVDQLTVSLDDLVPGSTIVHDLRNTARTGEVRFYVLAGTNEITAPTPNGWAWLARQVMRGADATLDLFFQDQNDLLINVKSMTDLDTLYPGELWQAKGVPCHHFDYYRHAEARQHLATWLTQ